MLHTAIRAMTFYMTFREGDPVRLAGSCLTQCGLKLGNNIAQDVQFKFRSDKRRPSLPTTYDYSYSSVINYAILIYDNYFCQIFITYYGLACHKDAILILYLLATTWTLPQSS